MANFDLTNLAVKMICPNNVVQVDDTGLNGYNSRSNSIASIGFRSAYIPEIG